MAEQVITLGDYSRLPIFARKYEARLPDDVRYLAVAALKVAFEPASWHALDQLRCKRAEGRISAAALDCALDAHLEKIIGGLAVRCDPAREERAAYTRCIVDEEESESKPARKVTAKPKPVAAKK